MATIWFVYGYTSWFLLFIALITICFSIYDGSIKEWKMVKRFSMKQVFLVIGTFIIAVALAFASIMLAKFTIQDLLHLQGWLKTVSQYVAVILALFPAQYLFSFIFLRKRRKNKSEAPIHFGYFTFTLCEIAPNMFYIYKLF